MRAKKIIVNILTALALITLSSPALAGSVEITTTVPSSHTVTVNSGEHGHVTVNGANYRGDNTFTVQRHESFTVAAVPDSGYVSSFSFSGNSDGIILDANSSYATISRVCGDVVITVSFASRNSAPPMPPAIIPPVLPIITTPIPSTPSPSPVPSSPSPPTPLTPVWTHTPTNPANSTAPAAAPVPSAVPSPATTSAPESVVIPLTGKALSMTASATVTGSSAEVDVDLDKLEVMMRSDKDATSVTIDVTSVESDINSVVIPMSTVKAVTEQTALDSNSMSGLDVVMRHASVNFDTRALNAISDQISGDTITLRVEEIEQQRLNTVQQEAISHDSGKPLIVEITLSNSESGVHDFNGGSAIVCLPYVPAEGEDTSTITVWYVAEDGKMEELACRYQDNFVVFTVTHFSNYVIRAGIISVIASAAAPILTSGQTADTHSVWSWLTPVLLALALGAAAWYVYERRHRSD